MTPFEKYQTITKEIEQQIRELRSQAILAESEYLATSPFRAGDKVEVDLGRAGIVFAFVSKVRVKYGNKEGFHYEFDRCKKDGTRGQVSAGIYSYKSIRKVEEPAEV